MSEERRGADWRLPKECRQVAEAIIAEWEADARMRRLWDGDASLWTGGDEGEWLGWLTLPQADPDHLEELRRFGAEIREEGCSHALLLGMGGSSLFAELLARTFAPQEDWPRLLVLDSIDPSQIRSCQESIDPSRTLFIVSSKSGTTLETSLLQAYFWKWIVDLAGTAEARRRFVAVTDPGSPLEERAREDGYRRVFHAPPGVGGRFSALSDFGLVPAAVMGLDPAELLARARRMADACRPSVPSRNNPGLLLGALLGAMAQAGRDKLTLLFSPGIAALGLWIEQLVAESTGKEGRGILPIDGERIAGPELYGDDRLFAHLHLAGEADEEQDEGLRRLEQAGQPVVRITLEDRWDLGGELFRWELATAVAGAVLGIDPFDQPDVEESKAATRRWTDVYAEKGALPEETPIVSDGLLSLFADPAYVEELMAGGAGGRAAAKSTSAAPPLDEELTVPALLAAHLDEFGAGDYFVLLAYLAPTDAVDTSLQTIRHLVRDAKRVATSVGYGPRCFRSMGQARKVGSDSGVFLQMIARDEVELPVPGRSYGFGGVKAAQARGDFEVLTARGHRALRVHLPGDVGAGLGRLRDLVIEALARRSGAGEA